jgi:hypothetical protein
LFRILRTEASCSSTHDLSLSDHGVLLQLDFRFLSRYVFNDGDEAIIPVSLDTIAQTQLLVAPQGVPCESTDELFGLLLDVKFVGAVWARTIKHPQPHGGSD